MSILVFFFIMDAEAIFSVVLSILSISCGTVAYLHLWDVNLDAVSLISMLMSIGFSVDYSAHICYHYYTHEDEEDEPEKKIVSYLGSFGVSPDFWMFLIDVAWMEVKSVLLDELDCRGDVKLIYFFGQKS
jgi:hypothetical protein